MNQQFNFIAGLPRSGSTLLAAILRQNPDIAASMSSPVGGIFSAMQKSISKGNEAAMFLSDEQREKLLRHIFTACYAESSKYVFDTNRMWPSKMATLAKLFPNFKMICCIRPVPWIVDSIESLIRRNSMELSGIFGFEPGGTVYSRVQGLSNSNGLVGYAMDALREGYFSQYANHMILLEYEALARHPKEVMNALYKWLKIPAYKKHDFNNLEQIPGAEQFDEKLGTKGLHSVRGKVEWKDRATILPPEIFNSFAVPFWKVKDNNRCPVISYEPDKKGGV